MAFSDKVKDGSVRVGILGLGYVGLPLVLEFGKASTSLIQRRLRVGYGRAAHLIDLMERDGIVGPADGPKPREILKRPDWLSEVEEALH